MDIKDLKNLMEAYSEVYAPQDIVEMGQTKTTGQSSAVAFKPTPGAGSAGGSGSGGRRASGRDRNAYQTSSSPGALRVNPSATAPKPAPAPKPTPSAAPATRPATPAVKPATSATARPTAASKPAAAPASKPAPTASATPSSATPAAPKRTFNPLMQKTFGYQSGYAPSQVKGNIQKMAQMGSLKAGFDLFDVVKGHLLGEGYADTEEAALAIMANMSEEWRQSIIDEEQLQELSNRKLRAYVKKSEKSHQAINKKWDQGTATEKEKLKSIGHERGQERAFKTLDKRSGK